MSKRSEPCSRRRRAATTPLTLTVMKSHDRERPGPIASRGVTAMAEEALARVIYGDPPWSFATFSRKGKGRSAEAWYDCLSLAELQALPVAAMGAKDSLLLLWTSRCYLAHVKALTPTWRYRDKRISFPSVNTTKDGTGLAMGMGY